jgi:hypothetical protein
LDAATAYPKSRSVVLTFEKREGWGSLSYYAAGKNQSWAGPPHRNIIWPLTRV